MIYSLLWKAARPLLRRHKRLRDGFAERLVPPGWPFTPAMQAPALINTGYGRTADIQGGNAPVSPIPLGTPGCSDLPETLVSPECEAKARTGNYTQERACPAHQARQARPAAIDTPCADAGAEPASPSSSISSYYCDLWIQAASGGESYLTWEILRLLAARGGGLRVLCTTCTRQGLEVLHKAQQELALASIEITVNFLPLDEPPLMRRAVEQVFGPGSGRAAPECRDFSNVGGFTRERVLVLLETEIWPGLLSACAEAGVKVLILNGRMTESSFKAYRFLAPFLRRAAPHGILATSRNDLERFCRIFDGKYPESEKNSSEGDFVSRFSEVENYAGNACTDGVSCAIGPETPSLHLSDNRQPPPVSSAVRQTRSAVRQSPSEAHPACGALCPEQTGLAAPARPQVRGLMRNIKFDRVFLGGQLKRKDPAKRPASGIAPYPLYTQKTEQPVIAPSGQAGGGAQAASSGHAPNLGVCVTDALTDGQAKAHSVQLCPIEVCPVQTRPAPILLASVREEEERQLLGTLAALRARCPECPVIIAPRHMHRVAAWENILGKELALQESQLLADQAASSSSYGVTPGDAGKSADNASGDVTGTASGAGHAPCAEAGLNTGGGGMAVLPGSAASGAGWRGAGAPAYCKRSAYPDAAAALNLPPGQICIWDAFGEMDLLYRNSGAVFVGGSLAPLGGQNFLEPLAAGVIPVIGPSWSNFHWAGTDLFDMRLVRQVQSADELADVLLEQARKPRPRAEVIRDFNEYLAPRRGGTHQAVELILRTLCDGHGR